MRNNSALRASFTTEFKKQYKKLEKSGKSSALERADHLIGLIIDNKRPLPAPFRDHQLKGNLSHSREAHFGGDYLLIYRLTEKDVYFEGIGSHSELFE